MENEIRAGTMLIEEDELMPESLRHQTESYSKVWRLANDLDPGTLARAIQETGWIFFLTEGEITATGLGFKGEKTLRRTINRIMSKLKWDKFNCLEIIRVEEKRILGLSMITVVACWRLLGPSLALTPEMSVPSSKLFQRKSGTAQGARWAA